MTALENIVEANNTGIFLNRKKAREKILALCEKTGLSCEPDKYVYDMSISEKQTLEILKVLRGKEAAGDVADGMIFIMK